MHTVKIHNNLSKISGVFNNSDEFLIQIVKKYDNKKPYQYTTSTDKES